MFFFLKIVKDEALSFFLFENMGKDSSDIKIWSKIDHSWYRPSNLLFHFTDSYTYRLN